MLGDLTLWPCLPWILTIVHVRVLKYGAREKCLGDNRRIVKISSVEEGLPIDKVIKMHSATFLAAKLSILV